MYTLGWLLAHLSSQLKNMALLTSTEEIIDNANNLFIRDLDVWVFIHLPVLTVIDERICDVTDILLKDKILMNNKYNFENSLDYSKIHNTDFSKQTLLKVV